ncbi:MAG: alpha/beta hydrolase, partial [Chlorobi bacterium]|nr:alpha/beta hydrolase [Chlorobiota bacterium]
MGKETVEGIWLGTLKISGVELRLVFRVHLDSSGMPAAVLDSPDQGAKNIPVEKVIVNGDSVRFLVTVVMGEYVGKFEEDRQGIHGEWRQAGMKLPLELTRVEKAP